MVGAGQCGRRERGQHVISIDLLIFSVPLALAALGEAMGQRSGVMNIGLEGQLLLAAFFAFLATSSSGNPVVGLAAGTLAALIYGAFLAYFSIGLGCDAALVGTAGNLLSMGATSTIFRMGAGGSGALVSVPLLPRWHGIDAVLAFLVFALGACVYLLNKSQWGLFVRAVGDAPESVHSAGISVSKIRFGATLVASLFAGLGGAYLVVGISGSFTDNMSSGRGFVALALVAFGRWKPVWVVLGCLLIGFFESLRFGFQSQGSSVPYPVLAALPYVAALAVLVFAGRGRSCPAALAQPFRP